MTKMKAWIERRKGITIKTAEQEEQDEDASILSVDNDSSEEEEDQDESEDEDSQYYKQKFNSLHQTLDKVRPKTSKNNTTATNISDNSNNKRSATRLKIRPPKRQKV